MTPEVKEWMGELGFDLYGAHYEARRIPNSTMWVHPDTATFFHHQFRLRELKARKVEVMEVPDNLESPNDYACYDLSHKFNKCSSCFRERRIADLNNQIAQLEAQKVKEV